MEFEKTKENVTTKENVSIQIAYELDDDIWILGAKHRGVLTMVKTKIMNSTEHKTRNAKTITEEDNESCFDQANFTESCFEEGDNQDDELTVYLDAFTGKIIKSNNLTDIVDTLIRSLIELIFFTTSFRSVFPKPL